MTLEEELREGGEFGDGCTCVNCRAADRIRELEAMLNEQQYHLGVVRADNLRLTNRIRELEAAIKSAIENEVSLDSERGSTWHILNDALALQSDREGK